jgi:hypothetical protein
MNKPINRSTKNRCTVFLLVLLVATLLGRPVGAITYISVEPIPSVDVVGSTDLAKILNIGYSNLKLWSQRLVTQCELVQQVIEALSADGAISTVSSGNTKFRVAAGGFEGVTDPTYVFTIQDSGRKAVSAADVNVLDNALGYVLNQGGTTHFSPDNPNAYDFPLDYAVVTFRGKLTGEEAKEFFDYLGTIDPALWNANFAGFTQLDFGRSRNNNSMLFLQPDVPQEQFVAGLFEAARTTRHTEYFPLDSNSQPTTATAGAAFPGNDWIAFPNGDQYLAQLGNPSDALLSELAALRQQHLRAVAALVEAIENGTVSKFFKRKLEC